MAEYTNFTNAQVTAATQALGPHFDASQKRDIIKALDVLLGEVLGSTLDTRLDSAEVSITNLNTWATALATKLNADAGVTDTNYDTTPQA